MRRLLGAMMRGDGKSTRSLEAAAASHDKTMRIDPSFIHKILSRKAEQSLAGGGSGVACVGHPRRELHPFEQETQDTYGFMFVHQCPSGAVAGASVRVTASNTDAQFVYAAHCAQTADAVEMRVPAFTFSGSSSRSACFSAYTDGFAHHVCAAAS